MYTADFPLVPVTVPGLRRMKSESTRITMLTAYDASFAACMDAVGVDVVLVGDSLGMVVQGHTSTLPVTVEQMIYHTAAVSRGLKRALLLADMPYQSYATPERALDTARQLIAQGGAAMVKLEGAGPILDCIRFLAERDISVCAHLGLTPQSVHRMGGYRVQGRDARVADRLRSDAAAVIEAGADMLVLECVPRQLAAEISASSTIPVIGIGAGAQCDGQVLVMHDALGVTQGKRPRFVRNFLVDGVDIAGAFAAYVQAVRSGEFPADSHGFS